MNNIVSITSQGQISIPAALRRKYGLDKSKKALLSEEENKIVIEPVQDFLELGGSLKTNKKPLSNKKLDELIAQAVADDYVKSLKWRKLS